MIEGTGNTTLIIIVVAALAALIAAWLVLRSRRGRNRAPVLTERAGDERPYVRSAPPPAPAPVTGGGVADEAAAATTDVYGEVLRIDTHAPADGDDLQALKGVGPKLAARLHELGVTSYAQLAGLSETEVGMLDDRLGPFKGRVARDRLVEQAQYLARGDTDGFEARFGKLGS